MSPVRGTFLFLKMTLRDTLKIYKDMYALLNLVLDVREHFPKAYKYSFGEKLMMTAIECCEFIKLANSVMDEARLEYLHAFSKKFTSLGLLLEICQDRHLVSKDEFCRILEFTGSIGAQARGWKDYTIARIEAGKLASSEQ